MGFGEELISLCAKAQSDVLLAAPFIKIGALKRLAEAVPSGLPLTVVVRFLPVDLATRATDFEIVEYLLSRPDTKLLAQPVLHAKLYRVDKTAVIGSANISSRALGWCAVPNLELLIELSAENARIHEVESAILATSYSLTMETAATVLSAAEKIELPNPEISVEGESLFSVEQWIPECLRPEVLYSVYATGDAVNATKGVVEAAKRDLDSLQVPKGLTQGLFHNILRGIFLSSPFYERLEQACQENGLHDPEAVAWLEREYGSRLSVPADTWKAIKSWLKFFNPSGTHIVPVNELTKLTRIIG